MRPQEILIAILTDLGTDARCFKLAKTLEKLGYRPVIYCDRSRTPLGPAWRGMDVRPLTRRSHLEAFAPVFGAFLLRLTPRLFRSRARLWLALDAPPLLWLALLGRLLGRRVVYDAHEIFPETPMVRGRPGRRLFWGAWHFLGVRLSRGVITVSPRFGAYFAERHPGKPCLLLPNVPRLRSSYRPAAPAAPSSVPAASAAPAAYPAGPAAPDAPDANPAQRPAAPPEPPGKEVRLVYQGVLRRGSGLPEVLAAMARDSRYSLDVYGDGEGRRELESAAAAAALQGRIRLHGAVPFEELPGRLAKAHVGLHLLRPLGLSYSRTLSNKIFDYMHALTPVLLSDTESHRELLEGAGIGSIAADSSPESILAALEALLAGYEGYREACRRAREQWCWERHEADLATFLRLPRWPEAGTSEAHDG